MELGSGVAMVIFDPGAVVFGVAWDIGDYKIQIRCGCGHFRSGSCGPRYGHVGVAKARWRTAENLAGVEPL